MVTSCLCHQLFAWTFRLYTSDWYPCFLGDICPLTEVKCWLSENRPLNVVRVGNPSSMHEDVRNYSLGELIKRNYTICEWKYLPIVIGFQLKTLSLFPQCKIPHSCNFRSWNSRIEPNFNVSVPFHIYLLPIIQMVCTPLQLIPLQPITPAFIAHSLQSYEWKLCKVKYK